jgi:acetyltransferase-like isoleucine patch superfamily enzyme
VGAGRLEPSIGGGTVKSDRLRRARDTFGDVRTYLHAFRLLHFYGYSHVRERRKLTLGKGTGLAPNVSIRNGQRISIGSGCHIGERSFLWAGDSAGRIRIGNTVSLAPEVFITASDYAFERGVPFREQTKTEQDVVIGDDVWLGVRVVVTAGVTIGDGCIVGAASVVTRDLPPNSIAVGVPARVIGERPATGGQRAR